MAYTCFVKCERDGCNSQVQVPQVGALPRGWIGVQFSQPALDKTAQVRQEQAVAVVCSWKCLMHFAKARTRGDEP